MSKQGAGKMTNVNVKEFVQNDTNTCYPFWVDSENYDKSQNYYELWDSRGIRLGKLIWSVDPKKIDYPVNLDLIYNLPAFLLEFPKITVGFEPFPVESVLNDFEFFQKLKDAVIVEYGNFDSEEALDYHCRVEFGNIKQYPYPA